MLNRHNIGCNIIKIICIATDNDRDGPAENNYQIKIYILYMPRDLYRMRERPIITLYSIVCVRAQWAIISEQRVIYAHTTFKFFSSNITYVYRETIPFSIDTEKVVCCLSFGYIMCVC